MGRKDDINTDNWGGCGKVFFGFLAFVVLVIVECSWLMFG